MRKMAITENDLVEALLEAVRVKLPASWAISSLPLPPLPATPDAILEIRAPEDKAGLLVIETKSQLSPGQVAAVANHLREYRSLLSGDQPLALIVAAPYLSPGTRDVLIREGLGYFDMTGNLRASMSEPLMVLDSEGAQTNPWVRDRPLRSLKGPTAGRVVRALLDFRPPFSITQVSRFARIPVASVYRVISFLEPEGLVYREPRGPIEEVDWAGLIQRWSRDYSLTGSNRTAMFLEPRGALQVLDELKQADYRYAITGSLATASIAPSVPARLAVVYVERIAETATRLTLRPVDLGANVILAEPYDEVVFERTWTADPQGVVFAALSQVAVDLLTSPGRGPVGGEELISWMRQNQNRWRRGP